MEVKEIKEKLLKEVKELRESEDRFLEYAFTASNKKEAEFCRDTARQLYTTRLEVVRIAKILGVEL